MSEKRWRGEMWFDHDRTNLIRELVSPPARGIRDGKIQQFTVSLIYDIPWALVGEPTNCGPLNDVYFKDFKIIPKECRERCYKVVVKPQTVYELYKLHLLQLQMNVLYGYTAKCGIDLRWYTHGRYAGYFYNKTLEEGQECYERVYAMMRSNPYYEIMFEYEAMTGKEAITLKKGCTEMQHPKLGGIPSSEWENHESVPEWAEMEQYLSDVILRDKSDKGGPQPSWLHQKIIYSWCEYAHQTNDPTYRDVLGYDPFEYTEDTYHKKGGDIEVDDQSVENPPKTKKVRRKKNGSN